MNEWAVEELRLLHRCWPSLMHPEGTRWCRIADYALPAGWGQGAVDIAFQLPDSLPGAAPYGFLVYGGLTLPGGGTPSNYTFPTDGPPWPGPWGQFSWALEPWAPGARPGQGTGMVDFARSFTARLREVN